MAEPMERIKNRAMRRANELTTARIIIDRHPCVGTGPFTRYKIAIRQVEQYTPLTIGWIGKVLRAVLWLGGIANHRPRMRRCDPVVGVFPVGVAAEVDPAAGTLGICDGDCCIL